MIVVGIAPGLRHLAYCVLAFPNTGSDRRGTKVDSDILRVGRGEVGSTEEIWRRKAGVHLGLIEIVIERAAPAIVAVGPALDPRESVLHVEFVRMVLRGLIHGTCGQWVSRYHEWRSPSDLALALDLPMSQVRQSLQLHLESPNGLRSRPVQRAATIAIAGMLATVPRETITVVK